MYMYNCPVMTVIIHVPIKMKNFLKSRIVIHYLSVKKKHIHVSSLYMHVLKLKKKYRFPCRKLLIQDVECLPVTSITR